MDPTNPVVALCIEGMRAEGERRYDAARALFEKAWDARIDDYDACVAAHYVARHQESDAASLRWNQEALDRAGAVADERVGDFYPSLHLNLGFSHEKLGQLTEARRHYDLAEECVSRLPDGPYGDLVRDGVARARERVRSP
jgi:hypothetical protein